VNGDRPRCSRRVHRLAAQSVDLPIGHERNLGSRHMSWIACVPKLGFSPHTRAKPFAHFSIGRSSPVTMGASAHQRFGEQEVQGWGWMASTKTTGGAVYKGFHVPSRVMPSMPASRRGTPDAIVLQPAPIASQPRWDSVRQ